MSYADSFITPVLDFNKFLYFYICKKGFLLYLLPNNSFLSSAFNPKLKNFSRLSSKLFISSLPFFMDFLMTWIFLGSAKI